MKTGVIVPLNKDLAENLKKLSEMGIYTCQLNCWNMKNYTDQMAEDVKKYTKEYGIEVTALWCGWSGAKVWDFYEGPLTLGLVPVAYRMKRCEELKMGSDFAKKIGVTDIATHVGFMPENPATTEYTSLIPTLREIAEYAKKNEQYFLFETGQETPITIKRAIEDIGTGNLGVNLDPANLILYGKANPVDALDVFGEYVRGVHGKDGLYPTNGHNLGEEVRVGDGKVNFPAFIAKLKEVGYDGAITIEREISGDQQIEDIMYAKEYLEKLF
ncbi:MAG: sugar phosphate isomerase/epimerase [Clostridia bacterium]|nr:sugar phosphate isomerase/epimerase [Clostridia bacterium]